MGSKQRQGYFADKWRPLILYAGLFALLGTALFWQLGSLLPGYSQAEADSAAASLQLKNLLDNPFYAPFFVAVRAASYLPVNDLLATRLAAALDGGLVLIVFAVVVRQWHDRHTALLATALFGMSAWFLHVSRSGTPDILLFGVFVLAAAGFWLKQSRHWLPLVICFVLVTGLLYVPGMLWFILLGLAWQWRILDDLFKKHFIIIPLAAAGLLGALAPLGWALYKHHNLILPYLGLPEQWPAPWQIVENLLKVPFHLFVHNQASPTMWLGTAPIFDVFTLVMIVIGSYTYFKRFRLLRTPFFLSILGVLAVLIALGGSVTLSVIIPFLYLVAAAGITYLLGRWFTVFPRNPIAHSIGWLGIGIVLVLACSYQLTHYFVGWPHATATHEVFTIPRPNSSTFL